MRHVIGWTCYALFLLWLGWRIWERGREAIAREMLLDEMRRREHDRPKPPRRYLPGKQSRPA